MHTSFFQWNHDACEKTAYYLFSLSSLPLFQMEREEHSMKKQRSLYYKLSTKDTTFIHIKKNFHDYYVP